MSLKDITQHELDRRNFLRLSGIAGAGAVVAACGGGAPAGGGDAAAPAAEGGDAAAPAAAGSMGDVPREKDHDPHIRR